MVVLHNLSAKPCTVTLDPGGEGPCKLVSVLSNAHSSPDDDGKHRLSLEGYDYRWFRVGAQDDARPWTPMP
jgi:maltose alpha-D-glucosyltransferase/alpha-amylase